MAHCRTKISDPQGCDTYLGKPESGSMQNGVFWGVQFAGLHFTTLGGLKSIWASMGLNAGGGVRTKRPWPNTPLDVMGGSCQSASVHISSHRCSFASSSRSPCHAQSWPAGQSGPPAWVGTPEPSPEPRAARRPRCGAPHGVGPSPGHTYAAAEVGVNAPGIGKWLDHGDGNEVVLKRKMMSR